MPAPGANLSYHNSAQLIEMMFRKIGFKPRSLKVSGPTAHYDTASDAGTTFPRQVGICAKYNVTTAPQSNTLADAPTGVGDICIYVAANNSGVSHIVTTSFSIYRCSAYTNSTTFTWTQWFA